MVGPLHQVRAAAVQSLVKLCQRRSAAKASNSQPRIASSRV